MIIRLEYFSKTNYSEDNFLSAPKGPAIVEGINQAIQELGTGEHFASAFTNVIDASDPTQQALEVRKSPTVIFVDHTNDIAVAKLETGDITQNRVKELYKYLTEVQPAGNSGDYYTPGGMLLTGDELAEESLGILPGTLGGLLGGQCPPWMPVQLCQLRIQRVLITIGIVILAWWLLKKYR